MSVCQRVGSPAGEALLEGYKPQPYTELVGGKTMAQVRAACWLPIFLLCFVIQICLMLLPAGHWWVARPPAFLCEAPGLFVCLRGKGPHAALSAAESVYQRGGAGSRACKACAVLESSGQGNNHMHVQSALQHDATPRSFAAALQAGCLPILHMRGFQQAGRLPDNLVADIQSRHSKA